MTTARRSARRPASKPAPAATLIIMARAPIVGAVKTRLAAELGAEAACELYRAFLRDLATRFAAGSRRVVWMCHPSASDFESIVGRQAICRDQAGHTLGARMLDAFQQLDRAGWLPAIMIGADVPHIRDEWLAETDARLSDADVVLGPSIDGGYYLIGMSRPHDVFSGVAMSTTGVLDATTRKAEAQGLHLHLLPPSFDVDVVDDLIRLRRELALPGAPALPATKTALERLLGR